MPAAARVGDPGFPAHPGSIVGPGAPTVHINGQRAATVGDRFGCMLTPANGGPHPPTPFGVGSRSVFIGRKPALRVGDSASCGSSIFRGARNVIIGG